MQREWTGFYLDCRVASRQRATIHLLPNGLHITTESGKTLLWTYEDLHQTQGFYAGEQVRLEHGSPIPEVLLVADAAFLSGLYQLVPRLASRLHDPSRRRTRGLLTLLAATAAIGIVAVVFRWGIPAVAAVPLVPVPWEERLGQAIVQQIAPPERRCDDPILQRRLDEILGALTASVPHSPYAFRVIVSDDPTLNAFAAPGGSIVLLRGLIERTATPEEAAGVLAHEAQHVLKRHSTRTLLQHASTGLLVGALTGDASGIAAFGLDAARTLGLLRYSRDREAEADAEGMRMILAAGIDPAGMIAFYDVLAREGSAIPSTLQHFSTHPSTAQRIERLRALAAGAPAPHTSLGKAEEWVTLRTRCRAEPAKPSPGAMPT
ncbi:MAG: M48 family metallopeptidase [Nitrospirae bacterium]|nr:M48 family metallopeptidase [Nitrospirota bacterium]